MARKKIMWHYEKFRQIGRYIVLNGGEYPAWSSPRVHRAIIGAGSQQLPLPLRLPNPLRPRQIGRYQPVRSGPHQL
jgi:hypothetical protein